MKTYKKNSSELTQEEEGENKENNVDCRQRDVQISIDGKFSEENDIEWLQSILAETYNKLREKFPWGYN